MLLQIRLSKKDVIAEQKQSLYYILQYIHMSMPLANVARSECTSPSNLMIVKHRMLTADVAVLQRNQTAIWTYRCLRRREGPPIEGVGSASVLRPPKARVGEGRRCQEASARSTIVVQEYGAAEHQHFASASTL